MKKLSVLFCLFIALSTVQAQTYFTRIAQITVKSTNKIHDVHADNNQVLSQLNTQTGELNFTALIKSFEFKVGAINRMVNSEKLNVTQYPKITFEGKIVDLSKVDFNKAGTYEVMVKGMLYIWDEKRVTSAKGQIIVNGDGTIGGSSVFDIKIEEKNVDKVNKIMREKLPSVVSLDTNTLGISRNIHIETYMYYDKTL